MAFSPGNVCKSKWLNGITFFRGLYDHNTKFFVSKHWNSIKCFWCGIYIRILVGGWLTDKYGAFRIQLISLFFSIPFYLILPYFKTFETLCLSIFFLSLIKELFRPANSAAVSYYAKPENLTRAFSLNRMALNLGYSVGPAIGGFLAAVSYDLLFYTNAFMSFCAGVLFLFYFKNRKGRAISNT